MAAFVVKLRSYSVLSKWLLRGFISNSSFFSSEASAAVKSDSSQGTNQNNEKDPEKKEFSQLAEYRFIYPEFLPNPKFEFRHKVRERLERIDMLKRRCAIDIPEFYVGSIMAVTASDPHAPSRMNRFVGICILREYGGLSANFTLRNVVDNQGVEIMYDMYNPTIQKIEVLRLEKRLDDELLYLRDALPEYSTFPFDMEAEVRLEGEPVPVNPLKVILKKRPWYARWERFNLKGVQDVDSYITDKMRKQAKAHETPWEKYDIMKEYRRLIPEEEQVDIWDDVEQYRPDMQNIKHQEWKKRTLLKAPPKQ